MVDVFVLISSVDIRFLAIAIMLTIILATPVLTFPNYLVFIFAGLNFGGLVGGTISTLAILTSSIIGYKMGDIASSDEYSENRYIRRFEHWVEKYGVRSIIVLRTVPLLPYNTISFGSGLTKIPFRAYILPTVISLIVWSYFWAYMGEYFSEFLESRLRLDIGVIDLIGVLILILGIGTLIYVRKYR